jgi:hypothetical protein
MERKDIKLSPKKGGNGYVSSFSVNIGISEAKQCGFIAADNILLPIEKLIDSENNQIIIRIKKEAED